MASTKRTIEVDLDDPRAGRIAEAMSSKSAKKILHLLSEREMSGSEVAHELGMPLNTVSYNLKKLVEAGLVDKSKKSFWSSKGKRMELYKVSNKKIIISPKKLSRSVIAGFVSVLAVLLIALIAMNSPQSEVPNVIIGEGGNIIDTVDGLKSFESLDEISDFLSERVEDEGYYGRGGAILEDSAVSALPAVGSTAASGSSVATQESSDYSSTNIQVQGVDEPDIVKNDAKYIYSVVGEKVVIVEAFPAEDIKILSEIEFGERVSNIFINEDKLIVFTRDYEYINSNVRCAGDAAYIVKCGGYDKQMTKVYVYDVSDRTDPELEDEMEFEGNYLDARMIGDYVYLVNQKWIQRNWFGVPTYSVNGAEESVSASDVKYFDAYDESYVFNIIVGIDLDSREVAQEVYLMGGSSNIYVSKENIYLSYMKRISPSYQLERYVDEVVEEILPATEMVTVEKIMGSDESYWEKQRDIDEVITEYMVLMPAAKAFDFNNKLENAQEEFYLKLQKELERTVVHRIEIDELDIDYRARGEVPGRVLNQFSMDEYEGNLRVATTTGQISRSGIGSMNHLYVLNEDLEIIGSVEDLAEGERIYSARFMGERAYLVTFKKVDPLFVIDVSDPENPEVLGYLKITGYSDYLHPYDENHIIGIGKETIAAEEGDFAWYQGLKISLFDVSDVENPKEVSKIEIGDRGTESYALSDHKAFTFDKEKGVLAIPISLAEVTEDSYCHKENVCYGERVWQGAYVLNIDTNEISVRGKITHYDEGDDFDRWYGWGSKAVQRSLWMDDVLYTVSQSKIKANDLNTIEEVSEVDLPYDEPEYGGYAIAE